MSEALSETNDTTGMVRPVWNHRQFFLDKWKEMDITVLICQRKTKGITQLCLESLLRFYPDIQILVVDGDSKDDSSLYLQWLSIRNSNVKVWTRQSPETGFTSHGVSMHEALIGHINTKYVLLLDSDTIVERGGWIEEMLPKIKMEIYIGTKENVDWYSKIYALGSLMLPSRSGEAITPPKDETDVLRYAHPSCSMIDRDKYIEIAATFTTWHDGQVIPNKASDHGSPLVWNMMGAEQLGYRVEYFPVDKYVSHLSGASWCEPKTIWPDDHDVKMRPFVTFIVTHCESSFEQIGNDYEYMVLPTTNVAANVVIHGQAPVAAINYIYPLRFSVRGEYVCINHTEYLMNSFVATEANKKAIELNAPEDFEIDGLKFIRRDIWQKRECLQ